jgi:hypothetical protein
MTDAAVYPGIRLEARPARDTRIDIVRGWLQLTIFASHAAGSWIGAWLIHGAWGLSDSSEQFVFLSGLMLGSVFARKATREGFPAAVLDMAKRTARLYRTHLITFFLFGGMIIAVTNSGLFPGEVKRLGWDFLVRDPARAIPAALTTLYQPNYMDILPVAALPAFAWLERRIGALALLPSFALYLAAWLFHLTPPSLGPDTVIGFNPLAWQVLFMVGVWLGRRMLMDGRALPPSRPLLLAAVAVLAVGLLLRLSWFGWLPFNPGESGWGVPESDWIIGKDGLALPRVLHALALALVVARLTPREAPWMHRMLTRWLAAAGRHSLHVFCLGLFLSWGVTAAFRLWPTLMTWLDAPLILTGCAILLWFGMWRDSGRAGGRPLPSLGRPVGTGRLA